MKDVHHFSSFVFYFVHYSSLIFYFLLFLLFIIHFSLFIKSKCVFFATELNNLKRKNIFHPSQMFKKH